MAAPSRIGVIVLAAGNSTRMGRTKQLLPYRGATLLHHAALTASETGFGPIVVVLGAAEAECRRELSGLPVHAVVNRDWTLGMGASVRAGIAGLTRLAPDLEAALILLHDQPAISAARLRELAAAWQPGQAAVASAYGKTRGVPALFARELFGELAALDGEQGARRILEAHRARVTPFDLPEALLDIDTPDDYGRLG